MLLYRRHFALLAKPLKINSDSFRRMAAGTDNSTLELKVVRFRVPEDWNSGTRFGKNVHDMVQLLLEGEKLWGNQFRYGNASSDITTGRQLRQQGQAYSQRRTSTGRYLILHTKDDSRDNFCGGGFFNGVMLIVVYDVQGLLQKNLRAYKLEDPSALKGIVQPVS